MPPMFIEYGNRIATMMIYVSFENNNFCTKYVLILLCSYPMWNMAVPPCFRNSTLACFQSRYVAISKITVFV
jgi:hypothetical protein